jgi:hypothetical protein
VVAGRFIEPLKLELLFVFFRAGSDGRLAARDDLGLTGGLLPVRLLVDVLLVGVPSSIAGGLSWAVLVGVRKGPEGVKLYNDRRFASVRGGDRRPDEAD